MKDTTNFTVGWIVVREPFHPVATGSRWKGRTAKLYQTRGRAQAVATQYGGEAAGYRVAEAFIEVPKI